MPSGVPLAAPAPTPPRLPVGAVTPEGLRPAGLPVVPPDAPRWRALARIAWPVILTNALQSLSLTVDLLFVGLLGTTALAAAGFATQVFFLVLAVGTGLSAAGTALVARSYGAGDRAAADRVTWHLLVAAFGVGLLLAAVLVALARPAIRLAGAEPELAGPATNFLVLLAAGLPASTVIAALTGAFQGAGDTRPALLVGLAVNVLNVGLDALLIFGWGPFPALGLRGAAIATSVAYVGGALLFLLILASARRPLRLASSRPSAARLLSLARLGGPAAAEAFLLSVGFTAYLLLILKYGAPALAAHQIGLRVQSFAFLPGFGLAAAAAALTGQGLGAGDPQRAEADGWRATAFGLAVMLAVSVPLGLFAAPLAGLFTRDAEALALGATWIRAIVLAMPAIAVHFTLAGALRGAGDTRWPLAVSFAGLWLVRLPLAWLLAVPLGLGMVGIWAAYVIEYNGRAAAIALRFARGRWKSIRLEP